MMQQQQQGSQTWTKYLLSQSLDIFSIIGMFNRLKQSRIVHVNTGTRHAATAAGSTRSTLLLRYLRSPALVQSTRNKMLLLCASFKPRSQLSASQPAMWPACEEMTERTLPNPAVSPVITGASPISDARPSSAGHWYFGTQWPIRWSPELEAMPRESCEKTWATLLPLAMWR